ncbi:unnamed protein product [Paramecium sonneborni]|uniref:Uncharacterized protein n=1 Tax=Paramecium sonneborni TaxID=65129 RepID=A0A8S1PAR9_9CILI|nr:unnamed protein product [Paramecium sonneborni]
MSRDTVMLKMNLELLNEKEKKQLNLIEKYAKNQRQTTKKQKEQYVKELDKQLVKLIQNLTIKENTLKIIMRQKRRGKSDSQIRMIRIYNIMMKIQKDIQQLIRRIQEKNRSIQIKRDEDLGREKKEEEERITLKQIIYIFQYLNMVY